MALEEGIEVVVGYLTSYYRDGGAELAEQFGDQAPALAGEMGQMLQEFLNSETPFGSLYDEYQRDPESNEAELIGALEVLDESVPEVTIRLQGYMAAFHELEQPGVRDVVETSEPEDTLNIPEIQAVDSNDDMEEDDDEYIEDNAYLTGNVEDRSTSAMYYDDGNGEDTSIEPNQSEEE